MQPPSPQPPAKKSRNGCLIALAIVGGLAALTVAAIGIGLWHLAGTKEGKAIVGAIGEGAKVIAEGQSAPGAAEVRELGCDQALVLDIDRMIKAFRQTGASAQPADFSTTVICQVGVLNHDAPTCDQVASTYRAAVGTVARPFAASVTRGGSHGVICQSVYDTHGRKVRDIPHGGAPTLPGY